MIELQVCDGECPRCGHEYLIGFREGKQGTTQCMRCGYAHGSILLGLVSEGDTEAPVYSFRDVVQKTVGAKLQISASGNMMIWCIEKPPSQREIEEFETWLEQTDCAGYITLWDDETESIEVVAGDYFDFFLPEGLSTGPRPMTNCKAINRPTIN